MNGDIGESSDDLLLRRKVGALLEFKVSDGARKSQVSVDTAKVDETAGGAYPCFLACRFRQWCSACMQKTWLAYVPSFWGLWSNDNGFALPLTPRTVLESPAFACLVSSMSIAIWNASPTYNVDFVLGDDSDSGGAAGNLLFVLGV